MHQGIGFFSPYLTRASITYLVTAYIHAFFLIRLGVNQKIWLLRLIGLNKDLFDWQNNSILTLLIAD